MSGANGPAQATESAAKKLPDDLEKVLLNWAKVRLGHEGLMLDKIARQQRIVEALARNTLTGDFRNTKGFPEEDMGVSIGNEIHYHLPPGASVPQQPSSQSVAPSESVAQETPSEADSAKTTARSWVKKLLPYVLAAALGGGGTGLAVYKMIPKAAVDAIDTVNEYKMGFGMPKYVDTKSED